MGITGIPVMKESINIEAISSIKNIITPDCLLAF
jgi:hypothetical protein